MSMEEHNETSVDPAILDGSGWQWQWEYAARLEALKMARKDWTLGGIVQEEVIERRSLLRVPVSDGG